MRTEHRQHLGLAWRTRAACPHHPQLDWIEPSPVNADECRSICGRCPVRIECLEFAIESREPWESGADWTPTSDEN
ncbi:WhiB family transcriptional regulator [Actinophytocola sp.]|uniref:WhiB family transcriptional regulator n=1 Tax=Actinophytocola sp. TaxID=1872138 RepID=UPI0039C89FF1